VTSNFVPLLSTRVGSRYVRDLDLLRQLADEGRMTHAALNALALERYVQYRRELGL
jgi:hypothetical protein